MVNFPSLTPSDFRWEAPTYEQVSHTAEDGAIVRQILMDTPGQGRVEVEFQNCKDSDFEGVLAAHDATYGQWDALTLPDAFWRGRGAALKAVINSYDTRLEWAFAEVPAADWAKKGRCTIRVILKHRVRPLALTLDPGGTATPLVPKVDPGTPALVDALPVLNCNIVVPPQPDLIGCQAFWTSRLNVPLYAGINAPSGSTIVADNGDSYSIMRWAEVGAVNDWSGVLLTKRDKDGNVIWQTKTPVIGNGGTHLEDMCFTNVGVCIKLYVRGDTLYTRIWHVSASGVQIFASVYDYAPYGIPANNMAYEPGRNELYGFETGPGDRFVVATYNAATGAVTRGTWATGGGVVAMPPIILPNGNLLIGGSRAGVGWLMELQPGWTTVAFAASVVQAYVYPNTEQFRGMCIYGSNLVVVDTKINVYLLSLSDLSVIAAYDPASDPPATSAEVRSMSVGANGIIHIAWRGGMLWDLDLTNLIGGSKQQMVSAMSGPGTSWQFENTTAGGYQQQQRSAITGAANLGVAWMGNAGGPEPGNELDRFMVVGLGLQLPVGTFALETHPPYAGRAITATVTAPSGALASVALPVKAVAVVPVMDDHGVSAPTAGESFAVDTTFTWDLQSAPACPPDFTPAIVGPATAVQGVAQQYTAVIIPDPALTAWPYTYFWSSPNATFSDDGVAQPLVTWASGAGTNRVLTVVVSNAGYTKTATLTVAIT